MQPSSHSEDEDVLGLGAVLWHTLQTYTLYTAYNNGVASAAIQSKVFDAQGMDSQSRFEQCPGGGALCIVCCQQEKRYLHYSLMLSCSQQI